SRSTFPPAPRSCPRRGTTTRRRTSTIPTPRRTCSGAIRRGTRCSTRDSCIAFLAAALLTLDRRHVILGRAVDELVVRIDSGLVRLLPDNEVEHRHRLGDLHLL